MTKTASSTLACLTAIVLIGTSSGCGTSTPDLPVVDVIKGKVLLPSGKPLRAGKVLLRPTFDFERTAKRVTAEIQKDGSFEITEAVDGGSILGAEYKVFIGIPNDPKLKGLRRQVPEKYRSISDDDTDLIVNIAEDPENVVLKMTRG